MIRNLKDTTLKNSEQDWLKTNLAKFSRMLQGQKDLLTVGRLILSELAPVVSAQQAMFYVLDTTPEEPQLVLLASYAYQPPRTVGTTIKLGEGLVGQCAIEREQILLTNVPDDYTHIGSGLGGASPRSIIVLPVLFEGQVKAVIELASFERFNPMQQALLGAVDREHRHRAQHDRGQHADRRFAQAVAIAGHGIAESSARIAADESRAQGKGSVAGSSERRSGTQEPRSGASPAGARRKGQAAWRSRRSTNRNSWRICRTSCERRSTAC